MKIEDNLCYKGFVAGNFEKKDVVVGTKISDSLKRQLDEIAAEHDRTLSYVLRELMTRGLALYRVDGRLRDDLNAAGESNIIATIAPGSIEEARRLYEQNVEALTETRVSKRARLSSVNTGRVDVNDEERAERDEGKVSTPRKRAGRR